MEKLGTVCLLYVHLYLSIIFFFSDAALKTRPIFRQWQSIERSIGHRLSVDSHPRHERVLPFCCHFAVQRPCVANLTTWGYPKSARAKAAWRHRQSGKTVLPWLAYRNDWQSMIANHCQSLRCQNWAIIDCPVLELTFFFIGLPFYWVENSLFCTFNGHLQHKTRVRMSVTLLSVSCMLQQLVLRCYCTIIHLSVYWTS